MSYRPRGHHETLPDTTDVRAFEPSGPPGRGGRKAHRLNKRGGQGFGPLAQTVYALRFTRRRPERDPAPTETGTRA